MSESPHRLPDFIIAGAPRSATTWLYTLARRHPQIAMAEPMMPEPKFFLVDELWHRGVEYYSTQWFDPLPAGRVLGEKSTNYLESSVVAERIHRIVPRVKLIFLLRNPVDRAYSNYLWSRLNGLEGETFERALALEDERERNLVPDLRYSRPHAYFSRGLYAAHLARFFDRFSRERILVLWHENVTDDPESIAAAFYPFLGVAEMPGLARGLPPTNATAPYASEPLPKALRRQLTERYRAANTELGILLGANMDAWNN
jgi:hypothetical protein